MRDNVKKKLWFFLLFFVFISCSVDRLPFKTQGFGGGFGGPQNEAEGKTVKTITHNPIIFVHGLSASAPFFKPARNWFIKNGKYNVHEIFAIQFSDILTTDILKAANELKTFVDKVLKYTGREKAVIVGHSRGAFLTRYYVNKLEGRNKVSHLVLIAGPMRGYSGVDLNPYFKKIIKEFNTPTETLPGIHYLCIAAAVDRYFQGNHKRSPFLTGAKNITMPGTDHIDVALSPETFQVILNFLRSN